MELRVDETKMTRKASFEDQKVVARAQCSGARKRSRGCPTVVKNAAELVAELFLEEK
jgi:hypothetical protein